MLTTTGSNFQERFSIDLLVSRLSDKKKLELERIVEQHMCAGLGAFIELIEITNHKSSRFDFHKVDEKWLNDNKKSFQRIQNANIYYLEPQYKYLSEDSRVFEHFCSSMDLLEASKASVRYRVAVEANEIKPDSKKLRSSCQLGLGVYFEEIKNYNKALHWFQLAVSDTDERLTIISRIALQYYRLHRMTECMEYCNLAISEAEKKVNMSPLDLDSINIVAQLLH